MTPHELLKKGLKEIEVSFTNEQIDAFIAYLSELKKWNKAYNLTSLKTDEDIIIKHFLDSLLYLNTILKNSNKLRVTSDKLKTKYSSLVTCHSLLKVADIGSGAGFPGIPLKIIKPEIELALIEPSRKKCAFLRHIVRMMKLSDVTILESRIESLGSEYMESFDFIVSRATFKIKDFLSAACPYIKKDGLLLLSKGSRWQEEAEGAGNIKEIIDFELPFIKDQRHLLILKC
ncbi:MAG: 16S rRNA (guanine(527)-N(7))-methyltransferase RsmG [Nitrospirae bacterium]|nr:16S rRNA (guanine(527)-N(7))-methyltransferase RsmG [Nitrospirota bacterium]